MSRVNISKLWRCGNLNKPQDSIKPQQRQRDYSLDCLRIFACFLVIIIHVCAAYDFFDLNPSSTRWLVLNAYDSFSHTAVPLFLMISGSLFLSREKLDLKRFLRKNLATIIIVYFVWAFIYAVADNTENFTDFAAVLSIDWLRDFAHSFANGKFHLWYLRALVLAYLLIPILHAAIHKTGISVKYCTCAIFFMFVPFFLLKTIPSMPSSIEELLTVFRPTYIMYAFYCILGYALTKSIRLKNAPCWLLFVILIIVAAASIYANAAISISDGEAHSYFYDNFSINIILESAIIFLLFKKLEPRLYNWRFGGACKYVSGLTLGIYLVHIFIIRVFADAGFINLGINAAIYVPIAALVVFIIAGCFTAIVQKIPLLRKIV